MAICDISVFHFGKYEDGNFLGYSDVSQVRTVSIIALMQVVRTSETSVYLNETTRRYIPGRCHFHHYGDLLKMLLN
jgi:hypothetical protein